MDDKFCTYLFGIGLSVEEIKRLEVNEKITLNGQYQQSLLVALAAGYYIILNP
jgi:hypothetical protein